MVVYTLEQRWDILLQIDLQKMPILANNKKHLFRWSLFWYWGVFKQTKLSHLGHRQHARIHWKADAPKTSHCLVTLLAHFFFSQWQSLSDIGNIWFQQDGATCHTAEAIFDVLLTVFEDRIISRRADVVWPQLFVGCSQR